MTDQSKTQPLLELLQAVAAMAEQHRDLPVAGRVQEVVRELQRELASSASKPVMAPGAAAIAMELETLAKRSRKVGLPFTAQLIDMAAYSVGHPD